MAKIRLRLIRRLLLLMTLLLCVTPLLPATTSAVQAQVTAQSAPSGHITDAVAITTTATDLTITWPNPALVTASAVDLVAQFPQIRFQGYLLPMQLLTVELPEGQKLELQLQKVAAQDWARDLAPAPALVPRAIGWETMADASQSVETVALPTTPLFVLRQGKLHGKSMAVIAFSPLYAEAGVTKVATALTARAPQARLLDDQALHSATTTARAGNQTRFNDAVAPVNGDALRKAFKVTVSEVGMQQIRGEALVAAGLNLAVVEPNRLQLHHQGREVALHLDGLVGGKLTANSTLRFYASQVGDRWNVQETYWLTEGESAGLRMAARAVTPGGAAVRTTALETGVWEENQLYDSRYEGSDGDHWFHSNLLTAQSAATVSAAAPRETAVTNVTDSTAASATVVSRLPRVAETAVYTVAVTTNIRGQHTLRVKIGSDQRDVTWNSVPATELVRNWQHVISSTVQSNLLDIAMLATPTTTDREATILLEKVAWQAPVLLDFGGNGAQFTGVVGDWRYQWSNLPAGYTFYDVTTVTTPLILTGADVTGFQDGPTARTYVVTGPGLLHTPTVIANTPITLTNNSGADALYIGPAAFLAGLGPLLQLRRDQGYQVQTVDIQAIYDGWSYGQVSAEAIRRFLRYAAANWPRVPHAVTLVGDGTLDPHNYEKKGNTNFVPPYMAKVDPWLIEAACEPCYGQLDGDDPVTGDDPAGHFFAAEMWVGRLPVKNNGDLAGVVNKLVSYERTTGLTGWQNVSILLADNYIKSVDNNGQPLKDLAGDFAKISDGLAEIAPPTVRKQRIYYDPFPHFADPGGLEPWRIEDAVQVRSAVLSQLSAGAGLVAYNGHSHHWQWAITDERPNVEQNWLLGLYDTDLLANKDRYFVNLSMTCLTSQFQKPAFSGTVIDERLFLNPNGGAIAVWGPSGLSVAYGHDILQRGFYKALWNAPPLTAKIGALIEAGNVELLTQSACCQDTLKTFLLLGDPLTTVRVYPGAIPQLYLPLVRR
ncbi:MAG: hypothetical protein DYG89_04885 [Caldilinea sp. CFX5]|nr:hypothetical protein [Caldilinea sp. CFX5]